MKTRVADWVKVKEAEKFGLVAAMTSNVLRNRTPLADELGDYFCKHLPRYNGVFGEDVLDDVLYTLNTYIKENKLDRFPIDFPMGGGADIHLLPVGKHIQIKVVVEDSYYGDGDYRKYIGIQSFVITESTTTKDVDDLVRFIESLL